MSRPSENYMLVKAIKLTTLIESILKVHRIKRLVEGMIREGTSDRWGSKFVVGPDSKVIQIEGSLNYHGDALKKYPVLWKKALETLGGPHKVLQPDNLNRMIEYGAEKLYAFMYAAGFIRGGTYWITFNPKTVPAKSLMTILKIAKVSDKKKFDVEAFHDKFYPGMTIDEFIEKFL